MSLPPKPSIDTSLQRSYGRVNGRKLRPKQQQLMDTLFPQLSLSIDAPFDAKAFGDYKEIWLEIGFGAGEHLAHQAMINPDVLCIGCEPFTNGVASLLHKVEEHHLSNVRIYHGDARMVLDWLSEASLDRVFVLFPDPWPKAKHHKKRLIGKSFLNEVAHVLRPTSSLLVATDHADYREWIDEHLRIHTSFTPVGSGRTTESPKDWVETRYQQKAKKQGRYATFFEWQVVSR